MFNKIIVSNFKSIKDLDVNLDRMNLIIGSNASGKSNFIGIFNFLSNIVNYGLDFALSQEGGIRNLINFNAKQKLLSIKIFISPENSKISHALFEVLFPNFDIEFVDVSYEFKLGTSRKDPFRIIGEELVYKVNIIPKEQNSTDSTRSQKLVAVKINRTRKGVVRVIFPMPSIPRDSKEVSETLNKFLSSYKKNKLIMEGSGFVDIFPIIDDFKKIGVYDFYPRSAKENTILSSDAKLKKDASNLSTVLMKILNDVDNKRQLFNYIKYILPYIDHITTNQPTEKDVVFYTKEKYFFKDLPSLLISHGTANIISLIIALFFEKNRLSIIEEIERNIHPLLIEQLISIIEDASKKTQIILTSHSPEIFRVFLDKNILFIKRDESGNSLVFKPKDKAEIKNFLEDVIGAMELYKMDFAGLL